MNVNYKPHLGINPLNELTPGLPGFITKEKPLKKYFWFICAGAFCFEDRYSKRGGGGKEDSKNFTGKHIRVFRGFGFLTIFCGILDGELVVGW